MFELTWMAQLINFVTLFFAGMGWTLGVWLMGRIIVLVFSRPPAPPKG